MGKAAAADVLAKFKSASFDMNKSKFIQVSSADDLSPISQVHYMEIVKALFTLVWVCKIRKMFLYSKLHIDAVQIKQTRIQD